MFSFICEFFYGPLANTRICKSVFFQLSALRIYGSEIPKSTQPYNQPYSQHISAVDGERVYEDEGNAFSLLESTLFL